MLQMKMNEIKNRRNRNRVKKGGRRVLEILSVDNKGNLTTEKSKY
jgi:hypothetical protein